ncbi:PIG-L deacetylase family protein [Mycolicibacterium sp. CBM1]
MSTSTPGNVARFAGAPIDAGGTPAEAWLAWGQAFPVLPLDECPALVVVAPHPDDETLGVGGAAAAVAARGVPVHTVITSDGGAAWPGLSPAEQARLEADRRHESRCAANLLGLTPPTFLGLPDGRLAEHEGQLADILTGLLSEQVAGTWCAATWRGDGHPDHEAVGRAAATATSRTGAVLLEYPVWMWHWAAPEDPDVPWHRAARVDLSAAATERKWAASTVFESQIEPPGPGREPILPAFVLRRLRQVGEVVFR